MFKKFLHVSSKSSINSSKRNLKFVKRVVDQNNGEEIAAPKFRTPDGPDVQIFDLSGADITEDSLKLDLLQTSSSQHSSLTTQLTNSLKNKKY
jgi:hypothetical protein